MVRNSLSQLEEQYKDDDFLRVSKSTLLNITKVTEYSPDSDRTLLVTLVGNVKIRVSRKFASEFKISTTGLAGGLLKPYKGFFPAQESKDSSKWFANRKTFSHQALKGLS